MSAYGTIANPLDSIHEPCPECGAAIAVELQSLTEDILSAWLIPPSRKAEFNAVKHVSCVDCGWKGSAFRRRRAA